MSLQPPVRARVLPKISSIGMVARFAFWPLAFLAGQASVPAFPLLTGGALVFLTLVASTLQSTRFARSGLFLGGATVFFSATVAAHAPLAMLHVPLAWGFAALVASVAALAFVRATNVVQPRPDAPLDERTRALVPIALFLALLSILVRFGAEALHLHAFYPLFARCIAAVSIAFAAIALVTLALQRAWTTRAYQHVVPEGELADGSAVPALSPIESDAMVAPAAREDGAYRSHRDPVVRVPRSEQALRAHFTRALRLAFAALSCAATSLVLVSGARATYVHGDESLLVPRALPPLPNECATRAPKVRFVPVDGLVAVDAESIAERYRGLGIDAQVESPIAFEPHFVDERRGQVIAEALVEAAHRSHPLTAGNELIIVLTDRDMASSAMGTNYVFAGGEGHVTAVSVARFETTFPWLSPRDYSPHAPKCAARLRQRAFKMITRQILRYACDAYPSFDLRSLRRIYVGSLDAVDAMEEDRF